MVRCSTHCTYNKVTCINYVRPSEGEQSKKFHDESTSVDHDNHISTKRVASLVIETLPKR